MGLRTPTFVMACARISQSPAMEAVPQGIIYAMGPNAKATTSAAILNVHETSGPVDLKDALRLKTGMQFVQEKVSDRVYFF